MRLLFKALITAEAVLVAGAVVFAFLNYYVTGRLDREWLWTGLFAALFLGFHLALYPVEAAGGADAEVHALQARWRKSLWVLFLAVLFLQLTACVGAALFLLFDDGFHDPEGGLLVFAIANGFAGVQLAILVRPAARKES